ncbi:MAG TPA: hypothetical protein VD927_16015 [Chryseosolibacter sp.]|nr:hypothetical protein [Chryseosolibacter sp.]
MKTTKLLSTLVVLFSINVVSFAQDAILHGGHGHPQPGDDVGPKLHVNPRWRECSFQLDPGLTQGSWREFTKEAGLVVSFRPLTDAKPNGVHNFEISILQWSTAIDESKDAWNDTFVHPDSSHWLVGGPRLPIMGLTSRMGITEKLDLAVYVTKSPGANYGFYGAQAQYNLIDNNEKNFSTSARGSFVSMYGPEDVKLTVYTADLVLSKALVLHDKWLVLSPYVLLSSYMSASKEKSDVVSLKDERIFGVQTSAGVVAKIAMASLAFEYNHATVNTISMKVGAKF